MTDPLKLADEIEKPMSMSDADALVQRHGPLIAAALRLAETRYEMSTAMTAETVQALIAEEDRATAVFRAARDA